MPQFYHLERRRSLKSATFKAKESNNLGTSVIPFYQLFPPKGEGRRKVLKVVLMHTCTLLTRMLFSLSSKNLVSHCMPAPLFQTQPKIPSDCHAPVWQLELQSPMPETVPALTSTEHCILLNHFGDISIRVDTEVTGALDGWKTKGISNTSASRSSWARLTSGNLLFWGCFRCWGLSSPSPAALLYTATAVLDSEPPHLGEGAALNFSQMEMARTVPEIRRCYNRHSTALTWCLLNLQQRVTGVWMSATHHSNSQLQAQGSPADNQGKHPKQAHPVGDRQMADVAALIPSSSFHKMHYLESKAIAKPRKLSATDCMFR